MRQCETNPRASFLARFAQGLLQPSGSHSPLPATGAGAQTTPGGVGAQATPMPMHTGCASYTSNPLQACKIIHIFWLSPAFKLSTLNGRDGGRAEHNTPKLGRETFALIDDAQ
eukprot:s1251_g23.t1